MKSFRRSTSTGSPPRKRKARKTGIYKSRLEGRVAERLIGVTYESKEHKVKYVTHRVYQPDFTWPDKPWLLVESKGFFRDGDALKYRSIAASNPKCRLVFIFPNPHKKYGAKRKDGSAMTYYEWCIKYGFLCYSLDNMPHEFVKGDFDAQWVDTQITKQKENK